MSDHRKFCRFCNKLLPERKASNFCNTRCEILHIREAQDTDYKKPVPIEAIHKWNAWNSYVTRDRSDVGTQGTLYPTITPVSVDPVPNDDNWHIGFNRYDVLTRTLITL